MLRVQGSLSRQLLGWQLLIIVLLLTSIAVFSVAQTDSAFRATEGRKMLSVAEDLAATSGFAPASPRPTGATRCRSSPRAPATSPAPTT